MFIEISKKHNYDTLELESIKEAKPIDIKYDTSNDIYFDSQKLMLKEHPELDSDFDTPLIDYYYKREKDAIDAEISFENDIKYIDSLDLSKEEKSNLYYNAYNSYSDILCYIGARIYY